MTFTNADQHRFARMTGDRNPVHLDPLEARRVAAGEPIVHGIHLLLRALESIGRLNAGGTRLTARFRKPALSGDVLSVEKREAGSFAVVLDGGDALVDIAVSATPRADVDAAWNGGAGRARAKTRVPRVRAIGELAGAGGAIALPNRKTLARAFPRAARSLGDDVIAVLGAISQLVGMECPGRDSLLASIDVQVARRATPGHGAQTLAWRVARVDARFGLVRMEIASGRVRGTVEAFVRPLPAPPPAARAAAALVSGDEFSGARALVIGGSRGIGAATALLVAAGGGTPLVTYARGRVDAVALRRDAGSIGRRIAIARLDVTDDPATELARLCARFMPTHLYYFATPRIFVRRRESFDDKLFVRFADFYVSSFARTVCAAHQAGPLVIFYPSTAAVDDDPGKELIEYAAAKAAGERVCRSLERPDSGLRILSRRLPRIATDQTASLLAAPALDPLAAMLPIVRELHALGRTNA